MIPPMLLHLRVLRPDGRMRPGIWLPLFIVWLLLLPFVVLALTLTLLADLVLLLAGQRYHHYTLLLLGCFAVLADARGTVVRVRSEENVVDIDLV